MSESDGVGVCHLTSSRIEWVWLHWSEYLKASEEFEVWLSKQQRNLDVRIELQLGVKEKLWQVDQQRVVVSDIHAQAGLLERLLDEAAALHNRTQDPSVEAQAQERLQEAYNDVRDRAEVRTAHVPTRGFSCCCSSPSSSTHSCCLCVASGSHQYYNNSQSQLFFIFAISFYIWNYQIILSMMLHEITLNQSQMSSYCINSSRQRDRVST